MFLLDVFSNKIAKGMSNIYYREKLTFSKLAGKVHFSEKKFEEVR